MVLVISAPLWPPFGLTPNRDSGVYLYTAQRMLAGEAPYRDVWDHKPPLVYLIDLAPVRTGAPLWGLWLLVAGSIAGAAWLLWSILQSTFGRLPAAAAVTAACVLLAATFKGNLPEEYGLLLQAGAVWGFSKLVSGRARPPWVSAGAIGVMGALAVLLKPTLIGLWPAMTLTLLATPVAAASRRERLGVLFAGLAGGAGGLALAAAVMAQAGLWPAFWDSAIVYNLFYATGGDRWSRWSESLARLGLPGLLALGGVGVLYLLGVWAWRRHRRSDRLAPGVLALALLPVIDLPIEALLSAGSGRLYLQYLTPWVPAVALLAASTARSWLPEGWTARPGRVATAVLALGLAASTTLTGMKVNSRRAESAQVRLAVEAVEARSQPGSTVLVWGAETQILVLSGRQAPSRYAYLYPLLTRGYANEERVAEFAGDLWANPPALVIDTSATNGVIPPLNVDRQATWVSTDSQYAAPPELQRVIDWLHANYELVDEVGAWELYVPRAR